MKHIFTLMLICATVVISHAQTKHNSLALKGYGTLTMQPGNSIFSGSSNDYKFNLSPAIDLFDSNGNFHEFELQHLAFGKFSNLNCFSNGTSGGYFFGYIGKAFNTAFRYEYNVLLNHSDSKWRAYLGLGATAFYSRHAQFPEVSSIFPTKNTDWGTRLSVVPRLSYSINEKWFVELNIPITVMALNINHSFVDNPSYTQQQKKLSTITSELFPHYYEFKFGVGRRFNL